MNTIGTTFNQIDRILTQKDETVDLNTENYLLNHYQVVDVKGPETIDGQLTQKAPSSFTLEFNLTDNFDDQKSIEAAQDKVSKVPQLVVGGKQFKKIDDDTNNGLEAVDSSFN